MLLGAAPLAFQSLAAAPFSNSFLALVGFLRSAVAVSKAATVGKVGLLARTSSTLSYRSIVQPLRLLLGSLTINTGKFSQPKYTAFVGGMAAVATRSSAMTAGKLKLSAAAVASRTVAFGIPLVLRLLAARLVTRVTAPTQTKVNASLSALSSAVIKAARSSFGFGSVLQAVLTARTRSRSRLGIGTSLSGSTKTQVQSVIQPRGFVPIIAVLPKFVTRLFGAPRYAAGLKGRLTTQAVPSHDYPLGHIAFKAITRFLTTASLLRSTGVAALSSVLNAKTTARGKQLGRTALSAIARLITTALVRPRGVVGLLGRTAMRLQMRPAPTMILQLLARLNNKAAIHVSALYHAAFSASLALRSQLRSTAHGKVGLIARAIAVSKLYSKRPVQPLFGRTALLVTAALLSHILFFDPRFLTFGQSRNRNTGNNQ